MRRQTFCLGYVKTENFIRHGSEKNVKLVVAYISLKFRRELWAGDTKSGSFQHINGMSSIRE